MARKHTHELTAEIAKRWNEGWTGGELAEAYGMTRNAVIGMANRNRGLFVMKPPPPALVKVATARREKKAKREKKERKLKMQQGIIETPPMVPPEPVERVYTLMDLGPRSCRWPVNNGDPYLFCGEITENHNQVYCCEHRARAVVPTVYKKRKPMAWPT